jgi:lipopolysaccharide/colanic/teichoic acid biosynthesis glycosyltransferase
MVIKRVFDIVAVCLGLPLVAPLMFIIGVVVKITSKGPVFFLQERVGRQEKRFLLYKFRTMVDGAEAMGTSVTTSTDPRITAVGKRMRRMKLDELPQLLNVLKGDMSLVGPRPDVPEIVKNYTAAMRRIFAILPGITSVATLHLRDEERLLAHFSDPDRFYQEVLVPLKVELAMAHVDQQSLAFDLKVLCMTVWMMTIGKWLPIKEHAAVSALRDQIKEGSLIH